MKKLLLILLCLPMIGFGQNAVKSETKMNDLVTISINGVTNGFITKEKLIATNKITISHNDCFEITSYKFYIIDNNERSKTIVVDNYDVKVLKNVWGEDSLDIDGYRIAWKDGQKVKNENRVKGKFTSEIVDLIKRSNFGSTICFEEVTARSSPFESNNPDRNVGSICVEIKQ